MTFLINKVYNFKTTRPIFFKLHLISPRAFMLYSCKFHDRTYHATAPRNATLTQWGQLTHIYWNSGVKLPLIWKGIATQSFLQKKLGNHKPTANEFKASYKTNNFTMSARWDKIFYMYYTCSACVDLFSKQARALNNNL